MSKFARAALAGTAAIALTAMAPTWMNDIVRGEASHTLGSADADTQVTEYVSYTCPACANFTKQGEAALKLTYIDSGKARLEIRHVMRNPVDLAATMMVWCGPERKFLQNHTMMMDLQEQWLAKADHIDPARQQRWYHGPEAERRKAVARDFDFYQLFETRGYGRAELDRCLADDALAQRLTAANERYRTENYVTATPSFAIDGSTLAATHSWDALRAQLKAQLETVSDDAP